MPFSIKLNHPHTMTRRSQITGKHYYDATWYCRQHNRNLSKICDKIRDMCDIEFEAWRNINANFLSVMLYRLNNLKQVS
jgi:predicted deacetylase